MPELAHGMDKLFIINLPERADRRRQMQRQLRKLGLSLQHPLVEVFPACRPAEALDWPTLGTRGCFISHYEVIRAAQARGYQRILVLEDDCDFVDDVASHWPRLMQALAGREWDVAYPGHPQSSGEGATGWRPLSGPMQLAHCYLVHGRVMPALLAFLEAVMARPAGHPLGGPQHYDGALNMFYAQHPEVGVLLAEPCVAFQRRSRSDISTGRLDTVPVLGRLIAWYRVVRYWLTGR